MIMSVAESTDPPRFAYFGQQVREGMRRSRLKVQDVADECDVTRETVRLWRKGRSVARDKSLRTLAHMIGVEPAELVYEPGKRPVLPEAQGEHVTDEDELALLRAYRGLKKAWARDALRARAVELLEKFGEKGAENPWGAPPANTQ